MIEGELSKLSRNILEESCVFISYQEKDKEHAIRLQSIVENITKKDIKYYNNPDNKDYIQKIYIRRFDKGQSIKGSNIRNYMDITQKETTVTVLIISESFLQSEACIYELSSACGILPPIDKHKSYNIKDIILRNIKKNNIIPIFVDIDKITEKTFSDLQVSTMKYWTEQLSLHVHSPVYQSTKDNLNRLDENSNLAKIYKKSLSERESLITAYGINSTEFISALSETNVYTINDINNSLLIDDISKALIENSNNVATQKYHNSDYISKIEDKIPISINAPEFPPENPRFPATETIKINDYISSIPQELKSLIPQNIDSYFDIFVKDESSNPWSNTHKDRLALEYRKNQISYAKWNNKLPRLSLISSGDTAAALQTLCNKDNLPPIKVLHDMDRDSDIYRYLLTLGCEMYKFPLDSKKLNLEEILELTNNNNGLNITDINKSNCYNWLTQELICEKPDYIFLPFGSGTLYENIIENSTQILRNCYSIYTASSQENSIPSIPLYIRQQICKELDIKKSAKEIKEIVEKINVMGATYIKEKEEDNVYDKLHATWLPFSRFEKTRLLDKYTLYSDKEDFLTLGKNSGLYKLKSSDVDYLKIATEIFNKIKEDKPKVNFENSSISGLVLFIKHCNNKNFLNEIKSKKRKINVLIINTGSIASIVKDAINKFNKHSS